MGSFINQCFATRQVINEGSRCRVIPLTQTRQYHPAECTFRGRPEVPSQVMYGAGWNAGLASLWKPVMGFIEVTAGDRADTSLVHNENTATHLTYLFTEMTHRGAIATIKERKDDGFDFGELCLKHAPTLWEQLRRRTWKDTDPLGPPQEVDALWHELSEPFMRMQVFLADYGQVFRSLSLGVIHEEAYQWLLREGQKSQRYQDFNRIRYIDALTNEAVELAKQLARDDDDEKLGSSKVLMQAMRMDGVIRDGLRRISEDSYGSAVPWFRKTTDCLEKHVTTGEPLGDLLRRELMAYLDDSYVMRGLDLVNAPYAPMTYAGQDYDNECGKRFAKLVQSTSKAVNEQRKRAYE